MMKTALCFGDSNTWGAVPMPSWDDVARHETARRWPNVMEGALGESWRVIAEGLPGRTTVHEDPIEGGHMSGLAYLRPCLESHRPLDLVVVRLGKTPLERKHTLIPWRIAMVEAFAPAR